MWKAMTMVSYYSPGNKTEMKGLVMIRGQLTRTFRPPFFVPHSLDELQGPAHGVVEVPHSIMWAQQSRFAIDLDDDDSIRTAYLEILGRASAHDMRTLVNKDHLIRLCLNETRCGRQSPPRPPRGQG